MEMLREPIGPYQVGVCKMDTSEVGEGDFRRKLSLFFFYPIQNLSVEKKELPMCPYMDGTYQKKAAFGQIEENGVKTYCYQGGMLSKEKQTYPVALYSHGLFGHQMESTVLCADLASNGYVVASLAHPYGSAAVTYCDGSLFEDEAHTFSQNQLAELAVLWEEDTRHAISCIEQLNEGKSESDFANRLDLEKGIHLLGVSFGGCVSIKVALTQTKAVNAVNFDGGLFVPLVKEADKPVFVLCSPFNYKAHKKLADLHLSQVQIKKIRGVSHWEFSDGVYLSKKGKANREWADRISKDRAEMVLDFWENGVRR